MTTNTKSRPRISVVIPTFNRAHILQRAVVSALNQTFAPTEVIVVDDGSTEDTAIGLRPMEDRVRVLRQANAGAAAARNVGVKAARHPWIAFLDSDDYWSPTHLEGIAAAMQATRGEAGLYFDNMHRTPEEGGQLLWEMTGFSIPGDHYMIRDASPWAMMVRQPMATPSCVVSRRAFLDADGFLEALTVAEDTHLFFKLCLGKPVCAVNRCGAVVTSEGSYGRLTRQAAGRDCFGNEQTVLMFSDLLKRHASYAAPVRRYLKRKLAASQVSLARAQLWNRQVDFATRSLGAAWRISPAIVLQHAARKCLPLRVNAGRPATAQSREEACTHPQKTLTPHKRSRNLAPIPSDRANTLYPPISVIVPTFNCQDTITACIESIRGQTVPPLEIIVVDEGSTDRTATAVSPYEGRIRFMPLKHAGAARARNAGVQVASGDWIAFLDSDDLWTPDHLERIARAITETSGAANLYFDDTRRTEREGCKSLWNLAHFQVDGPFHVVHDATEWAMLPRQPFILPSSVVRRESYLMEGGLRQDVRVGEESHFFYTQCIGKPVCAVAGCGVHGTANGIGAPRLARTQDKACPCTARRDTVTLLYDVIRNIPMATEQRRKLRYALAVAEISLARMLWTRKERLGSLLYWLVAMIDSPKTVLRCVVRGTGPFG